MFLHHFKLWRNRPFSAKLGLWSLKNLLIQKFALDFFYFSWFFLYKVNHIQWLICPLFFLLNIRFVIYAYFGTWDSLVLIISAQGNSWTFSFSSYTRLNKIIIFSTYFNFISSQFFIYLDLFNIVIILYLDGISFTLYLLIYLFLWFRSAHHI